MALDHRAFGFRVYGLQFSGVGFRISGFKVAQECTVAHGGEFLEQDWYICLGFRKARDLNIEP